MAAVRPVVDLRDGSTLARVVDLPAAVGPSAWHLGLRRPVGPALAGLVPAVADVPADGLPIHLRVTASQFASPLLLGSIHRELDPDVRTRLVLDLTGDEPLTDAGSVEANVRRLRAAGISLAVSGFGTGYANFRSLAVVRPDVASISLATAAAQGIAAWFTSSCKVLGVERTVVSGVRSPMERRWAASVGFDAGTGDLWPVDPTVRASVVTARRHRG